MGVQNAFAELLGDANSEFYAVFVNETLARMNEVLGTAATVDFVNQLEELGAAPIDTAEIEANPVEASEPNYAGAGNPADGQSGSFEASIVDVEAPPLEDTTATSDEDASTPSSGSAEGTAFADPVSDALGGLPPLDDNEAYLGAPTEQEMNDPNFAPLVNPEPTPFPRAFLAASWRTKYPSALLRSMG